MTSIPLRRYMTALLLLIFLQSGCDSQPTIRPLPQDAVVLAFGDSLTYGTGAEPGTAYPDVIACGCY